MSRTPTLLAALLLTALASLPAPAAVQTKTIEYEHDGQKLIGYLAYDDASDAKRPGILVVHEWWGLNDYTRLRCRMLAELGYVAFAADLYGDGRVTQHAEEAGAWARQIQQNIDTWQARAAAALDILKAQPLADPARIAAVGYCFGGATVCQLAYTGADVKGIVSFHGSLPVPTDAQAKAIKARILVCHGAEDNFIPADRIAQFTNTLNAADADLQFISYANARHAFTNPNADGSVNPGILYNPDADRRSWNHMKLFLDELFGE